MTETGCLHQYHHHQQSTVFFLVVVVFPVHCLQIYPFIWHATPQFWVLRKGFEESGNQTIEKMKKLKKRVDKDIRLEKEGDDRQKKEKKMKSEHS